MIRNIEFPKPVKRKFQNWETPFGISQQTTNILHLGFTHLLAVGYFVSGLVTRTPLSAFIFNVVYGVIGGLGITIGCHRYWTHKSFKAKMPLQILLMIMQTIAFQYPIFKWSLDHRVHHKYTDTNADPHNSKRGFWFSHIGWLVLPKHKDLQEKLNQFEMRDLEADPIVQFQSRLEQWYVPLAIVFSLGIPTMCLYCFWTFSLIDCIMLHSLRQFGSLHLTFCINSVAHKWGDKPYDRSSSAVELNFPFSYITLGEGFHNYHHKFPSDYRASEFGWRLNLSTMLIDMFAKIGWAYDLKTVSEDTIVAQMQKSRFITKFGKHGH